MATVEVAEQNRRIEIEKNRLLKILEDINPEKIEIAISLIERCAFMKVTLEILEDLIKEEGATYLMENGKQIMKVENPAQKSYNTMINRYTVACEKIINLLPKEDPKVEEIVDDDIDSF